MLYRCSSTDCKQLGKTPFFRAPPFFCAREGVLTSWRENCLLRVSCPNATLFCLHWCHPLLHQRIRNLGPHAPKTFCTLSYHFGQCLRFCAPLAGTQNPRVRHFFRPQFWGLKWLRQFYGRLAFFGSFCWITPMAIVFRVLGGGCWGFLEGGVEVPILFLRARGFFK